jgi:hypothetical protein
MGGRKTAVPTMQKKESFKLSEARLKMKNNLCLLVVFSFQFFVFSFQGCDDSFLVLNKRSK